MKLLKKWFRVNAVLETCVVKFKNMRIYSQEIPINLLFFPMGWDPSYKMGCKLKYFFNFTMQRVSRSRRWRTLWRRRQMCSRRWTRCSSGPSIKWTVCRWVGPRTCSAGCSCRGTSLWGRRTGPDPQAAEGRCAQGFTSERPTRSTRLSNLLLHSEHCFHSDSTYSYMGRVGHTKKGCPTQLFKNLFAKRSILSKNSFFERFLSENFKMPNVPSPAAGYPDPVG